jgi:hypothetical protein
VLLLSAMSLRFDNLDGETRSYMLAELEHDLAADSLYLAKYLSEIGRQRYPALLRAAIEGGTDDSLAAELHAPGLLLERYEKQKPKGGTSMAKVPHTAPETLAEGEFNRFYLRGLCRRIVDSGGGSVEIYRARVSMNPRPESEAMIGKLLDASALLADLRVSVGVDPALGLPNVNSGLSGRFGVISGSDEGDSRDSGATSARHASDEGGTMSDRFGQLLFLGQHGCAVTLDLYEESQIMGRGFYLGPEEELSVLHEVEVAIDREAFDAVETETALADLPFPLENHVVAYGNAPPLRINAYRPDPARKLITGTVTVLDDVVTFRAEEYGSPEIIVIIVVSIWALICGGSALRDVIKACEERAVDVCGVGGVKSVKSKRSWKKLGCGASCEIECIEGHTASVEHRATSGPEVAPA